VVTVFEQLLATEAAAQAACASAEADTRVAKDAFASHLRRTGPESFASPSHEWRALQRCLDVEGQLAPAYVAAHQARVDYEQRLAQAIAQQETAAT
jgi:hypothetical protein